MLVIHAQHIRDQLSLPQLYVIVVCWLRRSFLAILLSSSPRTSKGYGKAAGEYIHVYLCTPVYPRIFSSSGWHFWTLLWWASWFLLPTGHHCVQVLSIRVHYRPCSCPVVILCVNRILVHVAVHNIINSMRDFEVSILYHICQKVLISVIWKDNLVSMISCANTPPLSSLLSLFCLLQDCMFFQVVFLLSQLVKHEQLASFVI